MEGQNFECLKIWYTFCCYKFFISCTKFDLECCIEFEKSKVYFDFQINCVAAILNHSKLAITDPNDGNRCISLANVQKDWWQNLKPKNDGVSSIE